MSRFTARKSLVSAVVGAVLAFASASLPAQSGTLRGTVKDSAGNPVSNATVTVDRSTLHATSTASGRYVMQGVPAGAQTVRIRAIGLAPAHVVITIVAGEIAEHDFTLGHAIVTLAPVNVVVGSRAQHTAADQLAVPVDVYTTETLGQQGSVETGQILAALSPSVDFPHQSITDATDVVRPFTLRGLSADHTLVLVNGWRQHQTALVNTFAYGTPAGSSGVDLNALPSSAIERVEVLRDGASAQYGSDAIAGVVNLVMREGKVDPFLNATGGEYITGNGYANDGASVDVNGGGGMAIGRGSLGLFGEYRKSNPTNRAWADPFLTDPAGLNDSINPNNGHVVQKRISNPQPNYHWGDGLQSNSIFFGNFQLPVNEDGSSELYAFGGYGKRLGTGNGYYRYFNAINNWQEIYPQGFLPEYHPDVNDYSATAGLRTTVNGWAADFGLSYGGNRFDYDLRNTLNPSLGPCLAVACAPGPDGVLGTSDDPGIPNQTAFNAGSLRRSEFLTQLNLSKSINLGLRNPVNVGVGLVFGRETYQIVAGDSASWINGYHLAQDSATAPPSPTDYAPVGSSVFPGFAPTDASSNSRTNFGAYVDLESNLTAQWLLDVAGRFEHYSDFGSNVSGKVAAAYHPTRQLLLRAAVSTGFRAPGLSQVYYSHLETNVIAGQFVNILIAPYTNPAAALFGAQALKPETSVNASGGVAYTVSDNFTVAADFFYIKIKNQVLLGASYADTVSQRILTNAGFPTLGGIQFFTNGLGTRTDGVDVTADWRVAAGRGSLDLGLAFNYTQNVITELAPLPAVLQGTATDYTSIIDIVTQLAITKERPLWRNTLTATYTLDRLHALARYAYYAGFTSAQPGYFDGAVASYGGKGLADAEVGYRFNQVNLSIGATNLFNVYPDKMDAANNNGNTLPWAAASPFGYNGRYLYTKAEMALGW